MNFKPRVLRCKKGVETLTAVLMLFLMIALMTVLITAFYNYNSSAQKKIASEAQIAAEHITLTGYGNNQNNILQANISNTGTIEVTIKALYKTLNGQATYYCDPSNSNPNTFIPVGEFLTLSFPSGVVLNPEEKIVAATARGTRTLDQYVPVPTPTPFFIINPGKFSYGSLELGWENFQYKTWNGVFNKDGGWAPGWTVSNPQGNIAWKVTIKNVGTSDITLNGESSFTLDPTSTNSQSSPSKRSWYLYSEPTTQPQTIVLTKGNSVDILWVWSGATGQQYLGIYNQPCVCMAFLTFFGSYEDGTPYAQTIPFEATLRVT